MNRFFILGLALLVPACAPDGSDATRATSATAELAASAASTTYAGQFVTDGKTYSVSVEVSSRTDVITPQAVVWTQNGSTADCEVTNENLPVTVRIRVNAQDGREVANQAQRANPLTRQWFYCDGTWQHAPRAVDEIRTVFDVRGVQFVSDSGATVAVGQSPYDGLVDNIAFEATLDYAPQSKGTKVESVVNGRPRTDFYTPRGQLTLGMRDTLEIAVGAPDASEDEVRVVQLTRR